jgi:hypothetical protein
MKKKSKNQVYIPHQDKWNEPFPTPGKPNPHYYTDSGATFNKHLRTQNKWNEHFPTPGKPNPHYYTDSGATFNKHLRTQNKLKSKQK